MVTTAKWIPPSLCGCEFNITADFTDGSISNGVSYRHPKPFTITRIDLLKVCKEHLPFSKKMMDTTSFFDKDNLTGNPIQNRGYLKYPITNPTPAECLYTWFYQHRGQVHFYPCGCRTFQHIDHNKVMKYIEHPSHHTRCFKHIDDLLHMPKATEDYNIQQAKEVVG